jgi:hypothetical protein
MRRSGRVSEGKTLFEFVPSGTLDMSSYMKAQNIIDPQKQLLKELKEELAVPPNDVVSSKPLCFVLDITDSLLDVIYCVLIKNSAQPKIDTEHTEFMSVSPRELQALIFKNSEQYLPLIKFITSNNLCGRR